MKTVTLSLETMNKVMAYLSYQSYGQVAELIMEIKQNSKVTEPTGEITPVTVSKKTKKVLAEAVSK